jgi:hypothetical protein
MNHGIPVEVATIAPTLFPRFLVRYYKVALFILGFLKEYMIFNFSPQVFRGQ